MSANRRGVVRHASGFFVHAGEFSRRDAEVICEVIHGNCYQMETIPEGRTFVDVGAHIGCAAVQYHARYPNARIVCVEACPDNLEVLQLNVGHFAHVVHAACTYEPAPTLLNCFVDRATATGGSRVVGREEAEQTFGHAYYRDARVLPTITLEQIRDLLQEEIDVLKLDCEGSEFSILSHASVLPYVSHLFGEYHGQARWDQLLSERFADWKYRNPWRLHDLGVFHLSHDALKRDDVVFVNGCFDLLAPHHVAFLERARNYGKRLIVAINSDRWITENKGTDRPFYDLDARRRMLSALRCVDEVLTFDTEEQLANLIAQYRPILVKGEEYRDKPVTGARHASRVVFLENNFCGGITNTIVRRVVDADRN